MTGAIGSLASETRQLLDAVAERLAAHRDRLRDPAGAAPSACDGRDRAAGDGDLAADEHDDAATRATDGAQIGGDAIGAPAPPYGAGRSGRCPRCGHDPANRAGCTGCPFCAGLALLRGERPEAAATLLDGALLIVQALRDVLDRSPGDAGPGAGGPVHAETAGPPGGDGRLIRIDIR